MAFLRPKPPWFNKALNTKLARKRRIKAKGLAPVPATKAEQRALAASLTTKSTSAGTPTKALDNLLPRIVGEGGCRSIAQGLIALCDVG